MSFYRNIAIIEVRNIRKISWLVFMFCMLIAALYVVISPLKGAALIRSASSLNETNMKQDLLCLIMAYPGHISDIAMADRRVYLVTKSGKRILYDDKKSKSIDTKISYPDLQDMMEQIYPLTSIEALMNMNYDPGRARVYSLLGEAYGESKGQIENNLTEVRVGGRIYRFNKENQAAAALEKALKELVHLAEKRQDIRAYIYPCQGTYNYRFIAGTNRLSSHAYGIAIDLNFNNKDYWKWASREEGQKRLSSYPMEIVEVFEKNNFIWGGKWGHFDIMHFEYRPEVIMKARYFGKVKKPDKPWHDGVPLEDEHIRDYIKKIDEAIR